MKLCECGCGNAVRNRFLPGHNSRNGGRSGPNNGLWQGGKTNNSNGHPMTKMPGHPRAHADGYVPDHILRAEKALGKPLPAGAVVHHHSPAELVICQDNSFHLTLHRRQRALAVCGHTNWRQCQYCKKHDNPEKLFISGLRIYHRQCRAEYDKKRNGRSKQNV